MGNPKKRQTGQMWRIMLIWLSFIKELLGCGGVNCDSGRWTETGICLVESNGKISDLMVEKVIYSIDTAFSQKGHDIDLFNIIEGNISIESIEIGNPILKNHSAVLHDTNYVIAASEFKCDIFYRNIAHEILHWLAVELYDVSNKENCDHSIPYLFKVWCEKNNSIFCIENIAETYILCPRELL